MYFAGIDGGGTKSRLMVVDKAGTWYGPFIGKSTNLSSNSEDAVQSHIQELMQAFLDQVGKEMDDLTGFCIGSAGVDLPQNVYKMEKIVAAAGISCPVKVVNDVELVLESETKGEPGIIVVSGTGSIVYGKGLNQQVVRVGGWGHLVGDEGSGYWIGREGICRCLQNFDGRCEKTVLTEMFMEAYDLEAIPDILEMVYDPMTNKAKMSQFSPLVEQAAQMGDAVANQIIDNAVEALYEMVVAARNRLRLPDDYRIVLSGGTVLGSQKLQHGLVEKLSSISGQVQLVSQEPCMGAVYLAQNLV